MSKRHVGKRKNLVRLSRRMGEFTTTEEEATVYVGDLDIFVSVQFGKTLNGRKDNRPH